MTLRRKCACGCPEDVVGTRGRYATDACRTRASRARKAARALEGAPEGFCPERFWEGLRQARKRDGNGWFTARRRRDAA